MNSRAARTDTDTGTETSLGRYLIAPAMVRLITHNLLACHAKTCQAPANFPLRFADCTRVEVQEAEFNAEFLRCVDAPTRQTCSGSL